LTSVWRAVIVSVDWAEDKALQGCNLSADPVAEIGTGASNPRSLQSHLASYASDYIGGFQTFPPYSVRPTLIYSARSQIQPNDLLPQSVLDLRLPTDTPLERNQFCDQSVLAFPPQP
jgi:hypothetical protein